MGEKDFLTWVPSFFMRAFYAHSGYRDGSHKKVRRRADGGTREGGLFGRCAEWVDI
jgi:hypothetical protein